MAAADFEKYLLSERNYSPHTAAAYLRDLRQFEEFCLEEFDSSDTRAVVYPMIRSWIIALVESGMENRSVNRKISSLKSYYTFLLRKGSIDKSPLAGHKTLKTSRKLEVPFSQEEMERLLGDWEGEGSFEAIRDRLILELLYTTGIRRAELIGVQLPDLDLASGTLRVLGKRNKERVLPLLLQTAKLMSKYLSYRTEVVTADSTTHLFLTSAGQKLYPTLVYRIINKYLSEVSVKAKRSPHILRHTFATHLLNKGADMNSVKELLGHASLASTQVYTHNSIAELKRAHEKAHPRNRE